MHRDFLCEKWGCSMDNEKRMLDHLVENSKDGDVFEDRFRFLRGLVFDRFVDNKIKWFGWAGHEVLLGSVYRQFPWDIAPNFDVVVPAVVAVSQDTPVALSPHLGFFQHRPSTEARLLDLPGLRSVDDFLNPPREQTFDDLSTSLLSSPKTTFLAFEAHLSPIAIPPTVARVIAQSSVFTIFLPPVTSSRSPIPLLNQSHRKRFISLLNALRTPVHLRGTFSPIGTTSSVPAGGLGTFDQLSSSSRGLWTEKESIFRLESGGKMFKREEPRSWAEEHEEMILEWGFDLAPNHKTTPFYPPPYPPRRLEKSHALAFLPSDSETPPNSHQSFGIKYEIWDPETPAIREAAHDGEWWDGQHWIQHAQKPKKRMVGVVKRDADASNELTSS
ncbi:hypothetical protein BDY24DRAFT_396554 [Mrakia frigida]|uniref:uncharacterized protein n=1 Tax=Mrakia frigida TaxID=29902 RepID=UPI003FCBFD4C